ncbi:GNAT family N-acetyltransferase [Paractinoplanes deccanensis]|uniref:GNAT family N-acetyltransferase n=1 Tax=Paractinoplanes deccanensis TaxID=113561 RepID=A0ABQ3YLW8_9ACTN|nr:GNAT family N-acetyltransferase [Actinoplanes deccanensis]GID80991.1 GNAT family N-acetyltransferase [Actinoplanes deccanensis]
MALSIRSLNDSDISAVVEFSVRAWAPVFASFEQVLGARVFHRLYPDWEKAQAEAVAQTCRDLAATTWVAEDQGRPVGFVAVVHHDASHSEPDSAEIEMIAVDPGEQRRGIASALIERALRHMREAGIDLASVSTGGDPGHGPARAAYEKAGFTGLPLVRYYQVL